MIKIVAEFSVLTGRQGKRLLRVKMNEKTAVLNQVSNKGLACEQNLHSHNKKTMMRTHARHTLVLPCLIF